MMYRVNLWVVLLLSFASCGCGATPATEPVAGGNAQRGKAIIVQVSCGACHVIPGISSAVGMVGPPLLHIAKRTYLAGELPNAPDNMIRWLMDPPSVEPDVAMPSTGLSEQQARDVAAYLYTLR